ncbi:MAG: hypothetical protein KF864_04560 [Phycisphaeraceae bacterium]|nr:hypothetical protein [Phycisphaeraceae bacterium]
MTSNNSEEHRSLRECHDKLRWLVADLCWKIKTWNTLFHADDAEAAQTRKRLYRDAAASLFGLFQRILLKEIIMDTARLLDPSNSLGNAKNKNLTICSLLDQLLELKFAESRINSLKQDLNMVRKDLRDTVIFWRHKHIAHNSHHETLNPQNLPLIEISKVEASVESLLTIMKEIDQIIGADHCLYKDMIAPGGASRLLDTLRIAQIHRPARGKGRPPQ